MTKQDNLINKAVFSNSVESRRLPYRLRRRRFSDMSVYPGEHGFDQDHTHIARRLAECEKHLEKLTAENLTFRDLALRSRADLENARKRLEREKKETVKFANEGLVREMLAIVDNLERALDSVEETESTKPICDGIQMVLNQFLGILGTNGVEVIVPDGKPFDPHFHEAVAAEDREDIEDNLVLDTFQKGYVLRGRVVRPAMVRVARAVRSQKPEQEPVSADNPENEEDKQDEGGITTEEIVNALAETHPEESGKSESNADSTDVGEIDSTPSESENNQKP